MILCVFSRSQPTLSNDDDVNALAHIAFGRIQDISTVFNTKIMDLTGQATVNGIDMAALVDDAVAEATDIRESAERCVAHNLQHPTIFLSDIEECIGNYRNETDNILDDLYEQYDDILNCSDR